MRRLRRSPRPETQANLQRQLLDLRHGEYVDAEPELRELYGTVGSRPWAMGPHPWAGRRGTDRARALARGLRQTYGR